MVPPLLAELAGSKHCDVLLACPGMVYRRDCIDRLHTGEPHQVDLWRLRRGVPLGAPDLQEMIATVVRAALPGVEHRTLRAEHPYTVDGLEVDIRIGDEWVEIGECGLANPALLSACGHDVTQVSGLAMGLGLDRLLMLRKAVPDIRLLRTNDPRVSSQMLDLLPYRPVSQKPAVRRDLSLVVDRALGAEEVGDLVRNALDQRASAVEIVAVLQNTAYEGLPPAVRERLGMRPEQHNLLLRVVLRDLERTLTSEEANDLRDRVYAALHHGTCWEWANANGDHGSAQQRMPTSG
jgi:phenylalanyl-tRNA synthetase alpha chain